MIEYRDDLTGLTAAALGGFFEGWPSPPSPETHLRILRSSSVVVIAIDRSSGRVIGFGAALSDGTLAAYISLLEVRPEYRRLGVGSEIMRHLLAGLGNLYMVDLVCDAALEPFYAGFEMVPGRAMLLRNYGAQSGLRRGAAPEAASRLRQGGAAPDPGSPRPDSPPLALRPPTAADAEQVFEAVRESTSDLEPWMDWCSPGYALEDAIGWISRENEARAEGSGFSFLILDASSRMLGVVGLNQLNNVQRFANLGYWVRSSEAGHGVAAQAVRQLEKWAFEQTSLQRLELVIAVGNTRSRRVAEKVGARFEGVLRARIRIHGACHDALMYSLVNLSGEREPAAVERSRDA